MHIPKHTTRRGKAMKQPPLYGGELLNPPMRLPNYAAHGGILAVHSSTACRKAQDMPRKVALGSSMHALRSCMHARTRWHSAAPCMRGASQIMQCKVAPDGIQASGTCSAALRTLFGLQSFKLWRAAVSVCGSITS